MTPRLDYKTLHHHVPKLAPSLMAISAGSRESGLEPTLLELVKTRASQINGCAFCLDMHTRDARKLGESDTRLHLLAAWREAPCFTERERAALEWTEALTRITDGHASDAAYQAAKAQLSDADLAALTAEIVTINAWNRVAIAYRFVPAVA